MRGGVGEEVEVMGLVRRWVVEELERVGDACSEDGE